MLFKSITSIQTTIVLLTVSLVMSCGTDQNNGATFVKENTISIALKKPVLVDSEVWSGSIHLDWVDENDDKDLLVLQRQTGSNSGFIDLAIFSPAMNISYSDGDIVPQIMYTYRLKVIKDNHENISEPVSFTLAHSAFYPPSPSDLYITYFSLNGDCQTQLQWFDHANNETAYKIERIIYLSDSIEPGVSLLTQTSTSFERLNIGLRYFYDPLPHNVVSVRYRIQAHNEYGSSAWTNYVSLNNITCN